MKPMFCRSAGWGGLFAVAVAVAVALCSGQAKAEPVAAPQGVRVEVIGSGRPVLMVPGLASGASEVWRETCTALQPGVQCHLVQLPGFAGAPPVQANPWLPAMRDAVLAYVVAQRLEHPAVIGHSLGGALALMMAAEQPARTGPLVIVDALPFLAGIRAPDATAADAEKMAAAMRTQMQAATPEQRAAQRQMSTRGMSRTPEGQARISAMGERSDPATVTQAMTELWATDLRPLLPRITQRVRVLGAWAAYAPMGSTLASTRAIYERQYAALPQAEIRMSEQGYHFLMWDDKDWLLAQVREVLTRAAPQP
ncbi:MAG: alpha/beta hydrolase [Proteobacteria bacterium]|nr:alpha/beta hydrolase [Pseudomonadota bacterium]